MGAAAVLNLIHSAATSFFMASYCVSFSSVSFLTPYLPRIALIFARFSGVERSATNARSYTMVSFGFSGTAGLSSKGVGSS